MDDSIQVISLSRLAIAFIPVAVVLIILIKWSMDVQNAVVALGRMLAQLLIVGYVLAIIFDASSGWFIFGVLTIMVTASSWIALNSVKQHRRYLLSMSFLSIVVSSVFVLLIVTQGVIDLNPWFEPRYMIPLAGMIFASALNSVSLVTERALSELEKDEPFERARNIAMNASLIPITNSLLAVGLVSLPGMMTGQILSGVSPLIAARYQIMVMCMLYGVSGIASALFLTIAKSRLQNIKSKK